LNNYSLFLTSLLRTIFIRETGKGRNGKGEAQPGFVLEQVCQLARSLKLSSQSQRVQVESSASALTVKNIQSSHAGEYRKGNTR